MERALKARGLEPDAVRENAVQKMGTLYHEDEAVKASARGKAAVKAKVATPERVAVGNPNI